MKFLRTICLIFVAVIAFLAAAAALIVLLLPETDLLRKNVEEQLTSLTGQDVRLGSLKLSWTFPRLLHISLKDVSIRTKDGEQLLAAERVICSPALISLVQGKVSIESISLERFRAQVRRLPDGRIRLPLVPLPGSHEPSVAPDRRSEPGEAGLKPPVEPSKPREVSGPRVSIKEVSLAEGRIDWVDAYVAPGRETVIDVRDIKGRLNRTDSGQVIAFKLFTRVGSAKPGENEVRVDGSVRLAGADSPPHQVQVSAATESFDLKPFSAYIPREAAVVQGLPVTGVRVRLNWEKGRPPVVSYEAALAEGTEKGGRIRLLGDVHLADNLSSVQKASVTAETDSFQLKTITEILPPGFPLDAGSGFLKGRVEGKWSEARDWTVEGALSLEDAVPKKPFLALGKALRVSVQATLQPGELVIQTLEISESTKIATIRGKVREPFSGKPILDLNGEVTLNPRWLPTFDLALPDRLRIGGSFPLRGALQGRTDELGFEVTGDLAAVPISWEPYLEKPRGQKGSISSKGRYLPTGGRPGGPVKLDALTRVELAGAGIRLGPESGLVHQSSLHLVVRTLVDGKKVNARDGALGLRKGSESRDFLTVKGSVADLTAADPMIDAQATATVSSELGALLGLDSARGVSIKGSAPLTTTLAGPRSRLTWHLELPIDHLDVSVGNRFRKPGNVAGALKASGKLASGELSLDTGTLTLPGATVTGRGVLRDRNGDPGTLTFDLKKGDVDKVLRYFPEMSHKGLSGSVEATFTLTPSNKRLIPSGAVRLVAVNYRPEKADWSLEQMRGTLDIKDNALVIPEIVGRVAGVLESPLRANGGLKEITSQETLNGNISVTLGEGKIKAERLRAILEQTRILVGTLLNPELGTRSPDFLGFSSLTGDFRVGSGAVSTDNLRLKGPDLTAGAVGSLRLDSLQLDSFVGLHTMVVGGAALGKIPGVRDFVKKHEEVLKATGLDKELKRWGITPPDQKEPSAGPQETPRTPVTVFIKIRGPLSSPQVSPVLETALEKNVLSRLRSLIQ